jgi:hypothetical protein
MHRRWNKPAVAGLAVITAIVLTCMSVLVERTGPEMVAYGDLCGPTSHDPCYQPVLKGGFPVAWLYDAPGVSRERQLAFIEDKLHPGGFILDVVIYLGLCMLGSRLRKNIPG